MIVRVTGWGRAARKAGLVWGEQTAQELAQNAIAPVFETIASAMRSDMTPRDAGQEFSRYVEDIPATLAATGWLALIGGGFASVRDIKNPQADVDVALRHWGFSAEQSRRIRAAATPEAFDAAVHEEMPRRTPENIAAGRREAETAWQQAEQQQADPAQPRLEALTRAERGTEWIVRDSQGRETLRTPNSETAQLALAELQQSAARQRGAGDAAEANTPESPENLNQLRMSKGRQEPHRLAQPIKTRYLSHDEQLRDPAHVLQSTLRKSGGAVEGQQGKHGRRLASDSSLFAWADEHRGSYHRNPQDFAKLESGGGEHAIFRDRETGRLVKLTKPGLFGAQAEDAGAYLERLALSNRVFGDDVRFEGIVTLPGEHAPRVVTSQSFVEGRDATAAEQAEYLRGKGFIEHDGRWVHPVLGVAVWDTQTPGNVITRPDGTMQAVDLQVEKARPDELRTVRQQSGLGLPTVFSKAGHKEGGVSREQARQWVDEVLRKWGSQLDVTVHESAEAIPEAAMRDEVLREGDVDAFFNGSDGKIHLLADRVNSVSDAERLLKHEGFHWAVGGKLRVEYGQLVEAIGRRIPTDGMQEIIARYPKGTPELWVEEYLAHLAETNPQSPVWRQFVYEVKRLLRRVFGDRIEYTEQDIRSFLSKAQQRAARAKAADAAEFAKAQQELRFAKNKPKGPQRRSWEEVRKGDLWSSVKKLLPKENVEPTFFPAHGTQEEVVERAYRFITSNPIVTDWTGRTVYLPYGEKDGSYKDRVRNKAEHVVAYEEEKGTHRRFLDLEKAKWLSQVPRTIAKGRVRVRHQSGVLYFKNYGARTHMVVTSPEGVFLKQASFDSGLVTQYPVFLKEKQYEGAFVEQINPAPLE